MPSYRSCQESRNSRICVRPWVIQSKDIAVSVLRLLTGFYHSFRDIPHSYLRYDRIFVCNRHMHMRDTIHVYVLNNKHDLHLQMWHGWCLRVMWLSDMTYMIHVHVTWLIQHVWYASLIWLTRFVHIHIENRASSKATRLFLMGQ